MSNRRDFNETPGVDEFVDHNDSEEAPHEFPPPEPRAGDAGGRDGRPESSRGVAPEDPAPVRETGAARDSTAQEGAAAARPVAPAAVAARNQSCVMIGPPGSGKTTLLAAIKRACDLPAQDGLNLDFIAERETAVLIKRAINGIINRRVGFKGTEGVHNYPFEVHVRAEAPHFWSAPLEDELHVVMNDGGGEYLLPPTDDQDPRAKVYRNELIRAALNASSMVLCVDIDTPGRMLLETELAISLAEMSAPSEYESPVHWKTQVWNRLRRRPALPPRVRMKRSLSANRFLLLLTQVDKLCYRLPPSIERTIRFAEMIDPVEQARELLGVSVLRTISSMLKPGARFAVGVVSAMGFHPVTGDPFADIDGTPLGLASESGEDILRRWTPFGIRDAIYFLATGNCRGSVKELTADVLMSGPEPLEFSYSLDHY